jgi:hypothetical protein
MGALSGFKFDGLLKFNKSFRAINLVKEIPGNKNNYQLISRILFLNYHLSGSVITGGILLPTLPDTSVDDSERAAHLVHAVEINSTANKSGYTWHYSMQGLPIPNITIRDRRLLPYVFTLATALATSGRGGGSNFLWHCLFLPPWAGEPGSSPVHCSSLSGLSYLMLP